MRGRGPLLQKERDRPFQDSRSLPNACYSIYPLVTTGGGGALPLPYGAYCAKAVTLKRVTAAAVSSASAFMAPSFFVMTTENGNRRNNAATSAGKTH